MDLGCDDTRGPDAEAARAVAAAVDPITRHHVPDLEARIMYAFVHVTHGHMRGWWEREGAAIVADVARATGVDVGTVEWIALAALHAALICDCPPDPHLVRSLACAAAAMHDLPDDTSDAAVRDADRGRG